ncbi:MAG TPA: DUF5687 family protein [Sphingobacteriaceae bacterium]
MTLTFFRHQWKAFWRSQNTGKAVAARIIMGILVLYMLLNLLALSFFLDQFIGKVFPGKDVITVFNGYLIYYFLMDLLMRFQFQELPTLTVKPYLHLPVRRNQIVSHLSRTSLWSAFNWFSLALFLPFLLNVVRPEQGADAAAGMSFSVIGLTLFNNFFILWLKRKVNLNAWYSLGFFLVLGLTAVQDIYWNLVSLSGLSAQLFASVSATPLLAAVPVMLAATMYLINHAFLRRNLYLDELSSERREATTLNEIPFLSRFGNTGTLVTNEIKLILRNKRPRSAFLMSFIFTAYGLIFYRNQDWSSGYGTFMFCGMFMTGIFIINYGQFMFSWQSSHFDGILTSRSDFHDFFRSKILLFAMISTVNFLLTIPYVFLGWQILMVHFIMYLWNIGINTLIVLYFANRNYKRIDLSKGAAFNWEGVGATQWILGIPLFVSPYIIYLPFSLAGYPAAALFLMAFTALGFILTREFWLNKLVADFQKNRYKIAEGFRNN